MRHRLQHQAPPDGAAGGGTPPIPPELAAQFRAAAGAPVQVHQGNSMIPAPPEVAIQQARANGTLPAVPPTPAANPAVDFWSTMSQDGDIDSLPPPVAPTMRPPAVPAVATPPAPITHGQPPAVSSTPPPAAAAPSPSPGQPPIPTAEDPFDINRLLAGIQIPAAAPMATQPSQTVVAPTAAPPQAAPPVASAPPAVAPPNDEELQRQAIAALMPRYNLTPEDDRAMISEPGRVIPKLAAHLHLAIARDIAQVMAQQIPMMISQHARTAINANRAEMEFFSKYPSLNHDVYKPIVAQSLTAVRAALGPAATREEVMRQGATMAALRIRSQYTRPQTPQAPTQPFVPSNGGASGPVVPSPGAVDIWSQLVEGDANPW